jgi:hypothetical protein
MRMSLCARGVCQWEGGGSKRSPFQCKTDMLKDAETLLLRGRGCQQAPSCLFAPRHQKVPSSHNRGRNLAVGTMVGSVADALAASTPASIEAAVYAMAPNAIHSRNPRSII